MSLPPRPYREFIERYPEIGTAYEKLSDAALKSGPLTIREIQLVKLGIAIGMQQEGAVHAHVRRALDAGCSREDLLHAAVLAITTLGFPRTMSALSWINDVIG